MILFPDVIGARREVIPLFPERVTAVGENGATRYRKFIGPRWDIVLAWAELTAADAAAIADHVEAVQGGRHVFGWIDWRTLHWPWVPIGTGDGATVDFDLPAFGSSDQQFFTGAGTSVSGIVTAGSGTGGRDSVELSAAPADGVAVWFNATMRRVFEVSFASDTQLFDLNPDTSRNGWATRLMGWK